VYFDIFTLWIVVYTATLLVPHRILLKIEN